MNLSLPDWIIILSYLILSMGIALFFSRRAGRNTGEFFLTGRNLPWFVAGTTMVATTFAADTPLAVTELVAKNGVAGNWLWWNMLFGGMLTVFFFARFWRRAGIMTDVEFAEIRYSGKPAAFLRGFRALYLGLFMNIIIMGWVNLAMVKILTVMFPGLTFFGYSQVSFLGLQFGSHLLWVGVLMAFVAVYASLSGLWGVSVTDVLQFFLAMTGTIVLAVIAVNIPEVGGLSGMKEKLPEWVFRFTPSVGSGQPSVGGALSLTVLGFVAYLGVQWWASWYPGAEPGGGGYVAQRMMSARNEKHSLFATLWFIIAHYAVRPWPWIIVALVSLTVYPDLPLESKGEGFVMVMRDYLPAGLLGLLLAAFLAAYMSTISTQLNWGTSYVVNDFYRRFYRRDGKEHHYVGVSRITTLVIMIISLMVTSKLDRISDAWALILEFSGGIGLVLILRWFWWRINAWSEISAMVAPFLILPFIRPILPFISPLVHPPFSQFPYTLYLIVPWSTVVWLLVTLSTPPADENTLVSFYKRIHPGGPLWKPISAKLPEVESDSGYPLLFLDWVAGCVLVFSALFGTGKIILGDTGIGLAFLLLALGAAGVITRNMSRMGWEKVTR